MTEAGIFKIRPENTIVILLSFEGPDTYSRAGGLGVRVWELSRALAEMGFCTHLYFVGDPRKKFEERWGKRLILHRWCQWISQYHPRGVYQGEWGKVNDFTQSLPWHLANELVPQVMTQGKLVLIMAEEWHTAGATMVISDLLHSRGLRDKAIILWNANNIMGFEHINWPRLNYVSTITTVSRYMKYRMWSWGVNPLVIPNGIPGRLLKKPDQEKLALLKRSLPSEMLLFKIGRWSPDKRWKMAISAAAYLKSRGIKLTFIIRGGIEPYQGEVMDHAARLGLRVREVELPLDRANLDDCLRAMESAGPADILNLKFSLSPELLGLLYHAADAVLANSGHEPFGLVGLEAMAASGIAFTGNTGEEYARTLQNAVVIESEDPQEIVYYLLLLRDDPRLADKLRRRARLTARQYIWEKAIENLINRVQCLATSRR